MLDDLFFCPFVDFSFHYETISYYLLHMFIIYLEWENYSIIIERKKTKIYSFDRY